jgi:F0F1-type ATP synthase epsilon subunit
VKLLLVSPQSTFEYSVQWIEAWTSSGSLVIKSGHAPLIVTLMPGFEFSFMLSEEEKKIIQLTRPGFLEVNRTSATALLSQEI